MSVETDNPTHNVDVFSTKEGPITFIWPKKLSDFDRQWLCDWLDLVARQMQHQVELNQQRKRDERFTGFDKVNLPVDDSSHE